MGQGDWRSFAYGGLASCVAEFGTFPIDTTKTRLQIQGQKIDAKYSTLKYNGMIDCFVQITKQEGFKSLYAGIWPAVLRQATYGTIKFGTYYSLKRIAIERYGKETITLNVCCAVVAGALSSAIANPTDVLKGVSPTAQRAAVIAAVELPVYDFCKKYLIPVCGDTVTNHFTSSCVASFGSAVASTPIDVVRTRLMNQRKLKKLQSITGIYTGTTDCFIQTFKNEGFWALYKGFIPTWVRMGPWNIIFFITYEQLKHAY